MTFAPWATPGAFGLSTITWIARTVTPAAAHAGTRWTASVVTGLLVQCDWADPRHQNSRVGRRVVAHCRSASRYPAKRCDFVPFSNPSGKTWPAPVQQLSSRRHDGRPASREPEHLWRLLELPAAINPPYCPRTVGAVVKEQIIL